MAILAKNKQSEGVAAIEAGSYPARVYQLIHIGTIVGFQGAFQNKVRIGLELPTETHVFDKEKGPQPRVISQDYTLSFSEKANLRKFITACDPSAFGTDDDGFMEDFDVESLIGKDLLVTINQKSKKDGSGVFAFIEGTTRLPKGMVCPPAVNAPQILNYTDFNQELFDKLPDFLKEKIKSSDEYKAMTSSGTDGEAF
jgi:hypothetical protein